MSLNDTGEIGYECIGEIYDPVYGELVLYQDKDTILSLAQAEGDQKEHFLICKECPIKIPDIWLSEEEEDLTLTSKKLQQLLIQKEV